MLLNSIVIVNDTDGKALSVGRVLKKHVDTYLIENFLTSEIEKVSFSSIKTCDECEAKLNSLRTGIRLKYVKDSKAVREEVGRLESFLETASSRAREVSSVSKLEDLVI